MDSDSSGDYGNDEEVILQASHYLEYLNRKTVLADMNAQKLMAEEEKTKNKSEKKKMKRKKKREKKRNKELALNSKDENHDDRDGTTDDDINSEEELDTNSAFVAKAAVKISDPNAVLKDKKQRQNEDDLSVQPDDRISRGKELAMEGNSLAGDEQFKEAALKFTGAIELDPTDYRFFGNRSYCYDRMGMFQKAMKDADKAIKMAPSWPKGYYRKGRALFGLKKFVEAEEVFQHVLKLDRTCQEALDEIVAIRTAQVMECGFSKEDAEKALKKHPCTVQSAVDILLSGGLDDLNIQDDDDDIYYSDGEDIDIPPTPYAAAVIPKTTAAVDLKMDPKNPEGRRSLWVGNVQQCVTDQQLKALFAKYGPVIDIRRFTDKFCAFVNYSSSEAAGKAMKLLQGFELANYKLLIKYPDNPKEDPHGTIILKKSKATTSSVNKPSTSAMPKQPQAAAAAKSTSSSSVPAVKLYGPVNGNECYYWRTTGCKYTDDKCLYAHLPGKKGIDRQPWMKLA